MLARTLADVGVRLRGYDGVWAAGVATAFRWIRCREAACRRWTTVGTGPGYTIRARDRGRRLALIVAAPGLEAARGVPTRPVR
jgi:hypothetical protein